VHFNAALAKFIVDRFVVAYNALLIFLTQHFHATQSLFKNFLLNQLHILVHGKCVISTKKYVIAFLSLLLGADLAASR